MIHVIATIELNSGSTEAFLEAFKRNIPNVRAEEGCIAYGPTVDVDSGIPIQGGVRPDVVTIVEHWTNLEALHAHLEAPHMAAYGIEVKDLVKNVSLQVLQPV